MQSPQSATDGAKAESGLPPRGTPKNYLMAWLLVMLVDAELHGYEIIKALRVNFDVVSDPGTVYRALRQLERDGHIASHWDSQEQGPARRVYRLTEGGRVALGVWNEALERYRINLDAFFSLYAGRWTRRPEASPGDAPLRET